MNILIIGCGRVGAGLANALYKEGHDISVVDSSPESFTHLEDGFTGFRLAGVPIDSAVLRRAGIEECHLVAAVTGDDNTNLMVAQIAKRIFRVPKVLTRLYDPARQDLYEQEGLHTVCPTSLTVDLIQQIISESEESASRVVFGNSTLSLWRCPRTTGGRPSPRWGAARTKASWGCCAGMAPSSSTRRPAATS